MSGQEQHYAARGYLFPVPVFSEAEAAHFRSCYLEYRAGLADRLRSLSARDQYLVFSETHLFLRWVYEMVTLTRVLDAVESILGPNLMIWNTRWFAKMPGDKTYISWHQDATYWGLDPPQVTTAWLALSESTPENGCLRVVPGSHLEALLPQVETFAADNALSRGQEIKVDAVDESQAVHLILQPGEMSLHHIGIVHGSARNDSLKPRIGIAVRFITPNVVQDGSERQIAMLVRGADEHRYFDLAAPPRAGQITPEGTLHSEALRRLMTNLMPKDFRINEPPA